MESRLFSASIAIEDGPQLAGPPAVLQKPSMSGIMSSFEAPDAVELDRMTWGTRYNGPGEASTGTAAAATPNELEMSRPPTPEMAREADLVQSFLHPYMNRFRVASACLMCFGNGLNDSAPGALIPYMERNYKIGYATVSLIFIANALGFISAAFITDALHRRLGRAKSLIIAQTIMLAGYTPIVCTPAFPVVVIGFYCLGLGMAINLGLNNVFIANLANNMSLLGSFHGSYGLGGTIGPLIATAMVSHGSPWSRFYFLSLGVTLATLVFGGWAFWNYELEAPVRLLTSLERTASRRSAGELTRGQLLLLALKNRTTILGALFIFAYQGAEVSISGWVISFLISYRNGDPSEVGYVTAGFWGGITLGRFLLSNPAHKIGEKVFVTVVIVLAAAFQLVVWLVPNLIGNAVAVAIVGLLLGPIYPCVTAVFTKLLGQRIQMSALSFVYAMGSSGGAVAPFMTGLGAQAAGTWILHPVCLGLYTVMQLSWFSLPRIQKRTE